MGLLKQNYFHPVEFCLDIKINVYKKCIITSSTSQMHGV